VPDAVVDPLQFRDQKKYPDRIKAAQKASGEKDAMLVAEGEISRTPIVAAAQDQKAHVVGLSILSGSHILLIRETLDLMQKAGLTQPLVVGGIIPDDDARTLAGMGVAKVYTPKDFQLNRIMLDLVTLVDPPPIFSE